MLMQPLETDLAATAKVVNIQRPMYETTAPCYGPSVSTGAFTGYNAMLNQYNAMFHPFSPWPIIPSGYQFAAPAAPLMSVAHEEERIEPRATGDRLDSSRNLGSRAGDAIFDEEVKKSYSQFKDRVLSSVKRTKHGDTNPRMKRTKHRLAATSSATDEEDPTYLERRRRNNESARKSREARRAKGDEISIRVAFLEKEYLRLQCENKLLKNQNLQYKGLLFKNPTMKYCFERIALGPN